MAVIQNDTERSAALSELEYLWNFLRQVENRNPEHGSTKAGIHKMMARIHEELMEYEARREFEAAQVNGVTGHEEAVQSAAGTTVASD
jgi:hypothetical protein